MRKERSDAASGETQYSGILYANSQGTITIVNIGEQMFRLEAPEQQTRFATR